MAMEAEVDRISISVESSSAQAKAQLGQLKRSLTDLNKIANSVNLTKISDELTRLDQVLAVFSTDRANSMVTVADALNQIKNVRTLGLNRVVGQLNDLADAIIRIDSEKLQTIAGSLSGIRGGANNIGQQGRQGQAGGNVVQGGTTDVAPRTVNAVEQTELAVEGATSNAETSLTNFGVVATTIFDRLRATGVSVAHAIGNGFAFAGRQALRVATGPFRMVYSAISRLRMPLNNFMRMVKRRLLYRLINAIISMVSKAVKEGISNLYQYSKAINGVFSQSMDKMATSFLYLKNSVGAMLAPVLNALAPVIDRLVDKWVNMLNVINETFAKMTGAKTWTRALKYVTEYADEADDASNKVKKLKNTILGIDEINLMNDNSATSIGSEKTQLDYSKMFEEVEVDIDETPLMRKLDRIKKVFSTIFGPIKEGWQKYGQPVVDKFHAMTDKIRKLWDKVLGKVGEIWQKLGADVVVKHLLEMVEKIFEFVGYVADVAYETLDELGESTVVASILGLVDSIFTLVSSILDDIIESDKESGNLKKTFELIDGILSGIFDIFTTIISKIQEACDKGDNGKRLVESIHSLINEILGFIKNIVDNVVDFLETTDFEPLVTAITTLCDSLGEIVSTLKEKLQPIWDDIVKPILKWLLENGIPGVLEAIAGALDIITGVLTLDMDKIGQGFEKLFSGIWTVIKPIVGNICKALELIVNAVVKLLKAAGFDVEYVDYTSWIYGNPTTNVANEIAAGRGSNLMSATGSTYTRQQAVDFANQFGMSVDEVMKKWNAAGMTYRGFASGGMPPQGTAFIAGEAGPEIVANINGRSGVMNVEQMSEGVAQGVRDANEAQNALLREQNSLLRVLIDKEFSATAIVSTDDIIAGLQRNNRRNGRTIVPIGV